MGIELIHADGGFNELRELMEFDQFDANISMSPESGDNDWMLELPSLEWQRMPVLPGHFVYISGSEWGGQAERIRHSTSDSTVRVYGTCWRGILARKAVCPPAGDTHVVFSSTDASQVISSLLGGWMPRIFRTADGSSGISCSGSVRYKPLLDALYSLLGDASARLCVRFTEGMVRLWAERIRDHSSDIELSQDYESVIIAERRLSQFNHIVALGQGEMLERDVKELWLLPDGSVTENSSSPGVPEAGMISTYIYDYPAVESASVLRSEAEKKLRSLAGGDSMEITVSGSESELELTDRVSVRDRLTGISSILSVYEKNLNISAGGVRIKHILK